MVLKFHLPAEPLRRYVSQMVYHEGYAPPHSIERFLPDGSVDLVIDLTDDEKYVHDNDSLVRIQACRRCWVSGMRTRYISIGVGSGSSMLVVNFRAAGAGPFLHVPLHEIVDVILDAETVFGSSILRLRERLQSLATPELRFRATEAWLRGRTRPAHNGQSLAVAATAMIDVSPQLATVDSVAAEAGVSAKHLLHVFREYLGVTPKQYQRIRRFQTVVNCLESDRAVNWAQVALECGFYDQAHLIKDFGRFCGMTPSQYVESKGPLLNYIPVA